MKRNIMLGGLIAILSLFIFSPRARKSVANTFNEDSIDKLVEFKNVITDWKMNQDLYK
ncbi:hypothetical protein [Pseudogracilibacillus sp. ICA-222130]|uniref:hypothetical protein n=1 Tax=Pseudogracilibacillus sp. ICA-222130 TaxID=3134655 RepID=UPI0030BE6DE1